MQEQKIVNTIPDAQLTDLLWFQSGRIRILSFELVLIFKSMDSKSKVLDYIPTDMTPKFLSRLYVEYCDLNLAVKWHQIWMHNIVEVLVNDGREICDDMMS